MTRRAKIVIRKWTRRILRIHDTPHSISLGVAIGFFIGWGPLYGAHTLLTIVLAAITRCNKAAALLSCWINNPVTLLPISYLQYVLGSLIMTGDTGQGWQAIKRLASAFEEISLMNFRESMGILGQKVGEVGWGVMWPWLVGSIVSSTLLAAISYPVARRAVIRHRHKAEQRRAARHARLHALRELHERQAKEHGGEPKGGEARG